MEKFRRCVEEKNAGRKHELQGEEQEEERRLERMTKTGPPGPG